MLLSLLLVRAMPSWCIDACLIPLAWQVLRAHQGDADVAEAACFLLSAVAKDAPEQVRATAPNIALSPTPLLCYAICGQPHLLVRSESKHTASQLGSCGQAYLLVRCQQDTSQSRCAGQLRRAGSLWCLECVGIGSRTRVGTCWHRQQCSCCPHHTCSCALVLLAQAAVQVRLVRA
jgi:hypothetical protein